MQTPSFLWGAATSAHQVEGNNIHNDWWAWEQKHPAFPSSGVACDHYRRFTEDLALAKALGHTAHRFSLEWSRIEPVKGQFNRHAIEHYREVLLELRRLGMKSFVTLHHFTNPAWLADEGGWTSSNAPEYFARYVRYVAQHLSYDVDFWLTVNEPVIYATQSYFQGIWPPQQHHLGKTLRVVSHLAKAHKLAYRLIHQVDPRAEVGLAHQMIGYKPEHIWQIDDRLVTNIQRWWFNHRFLSRIRNHYDFLGVNYYFTHIKRVGVLPPHVTSVSTPKEKTTDMGWPITPEGLTEALLDLKKYGKPIYITENGIADAADEKRADFIRSHLKAIERAQQRGVDVRGYLYWSLLDNFEWAQGFTPRFGLVAVDYATQQRIPRPSAYVYKAIIEQAHRS